VKAAAKCHFQGEDKLVAFSRNLYSFGREEISVKVGERNKVDIVGPRHHIPALPTSQEHSAWTRWSK
jgi:hypothetical protein